MSTRSVSLPFSPLLPTLNPPSSATRLPALLRPFTPIPAHGHRPAPPWRGSLDATTRPDRLEGLANLALMALTLPAVVLSQIGLWRLLDGGVLDRAIRAFLAAGGF